MRQPIIRGERNVDVRIGNELHRWGVMLPSKAVKKAHVMVRGMVGVEIYKGRNDIEVTASVIVDGSDYVSVCGLWLNGSIKVIHL